MMHAKATILSSAIAVFLTTAIAVPTAQAASGGPVINAVSPSSVIEKPVPQPTITITGSNLRQPGVFDSSGNPTITITHTANPKISFSAVAGTNFSGTQATIPAGLNHFNLLQAPLGSYDVTVTRPDGQSATATGAFSINTQPAPEPGEIKMRIASYWGGPIMGMDLSPDGQTAYIANGRVLRILDISNEANPTSIGSIYLGGVYDVKVKGGYAFVAAQGPYSFCVVDVSDPASPELVWSHNSSTTRRHVELYGDYAYARRDTSSSPIGVFDISDPLNVVSKGTISGTAFTIDGDRLVTNQGIHDLAANPINPPLITSYSAGSGPARAVAATSSHVYITGGSVGDGGWLRTINTSNPESPALTDSKGDFYVAENAIILNGRLYVTDRRNGAPASPSQGQGLVVFDITSNPSEPVLLTTYKSHSLSDPYGLYADPAGGRLFKFENSEGLIVLDVASGVEPQRRGKYHSPSSLRRMQKSGENLFILDWYGGFTVLDVSTPGSPEVLSNHMLHSVDDIRASGEDIAYQNGLIYISARNMGFEVVDVSEPSSPVLVGNFFPPPPNWGNMSHFIGLAVADNVAHIGFRDQISVSSAALRYLTVDVSNHHQMFELARSAHIPNYPANAIVLHESGVVAYTAHGPGGTRQINVSDVANPSDVGMIPLGLNDADLAIVGDTLFVAASDTISGNPGLHILDVAQTSPESMSYTNSGPVRAVDVQNDRAYVVGLGTGSGLNLKLLDVSDPAVPAEIDSLSGSIGTPFQNSVLVDEPHVYVTSMQTGSDNPARAGLVIVDVHGVEPQGPLGDLNGDGAVNVSDLLILLAAWGGCPTGGTPVPPCPADLNGDGVVDVSDLLILFSNWG